VFTTVIAATVALSILIFVHELGHFLAAKKADVRVEKFSLGMGPKVVGITRGETQYILSAIPFGGYVRMAGDDPEQGASGDEREFLAKKKSTRALIVAAGPAMNTLLAAVVFISVTAFVGVETIKTRFVGGVIEGSPSWEAGLMEGDEIVSVGDEYIQTWDDMVETLESRIGERVEVAVNRNGRREMKLLDLTSVRSVVEVGIYSFRESRIGEVKRDGPAYIAGLRSGDRITKIDDVPIRTWNELRETIRSSPNKELTMVWQSGAIERSSEVTPRDLGGYGVIDITYAIEKRRVGIAESIKIGLGTTVFVSKQIFQLPRLLLMFLRGEASRDMIGGPVRISELAGETLRWGLTAFLGFIAAISAQLSLVNLLPIPVLDGGHLLILGIETVTRKPITPRQRIIAHQIGFAFLFALMLVVTFVDVSRYVGR
jgi:regulator of sigma E protease